MEIFYLQPSFSNSPQTSKICGKKYISKKTRLLAPYCFLKIQMGIGCGLQQYRFLHQDMLEEANENCSLFRERDLGTGRLGTAARARFGQADHPAAQRPSAYDTAVRDYEARLRGSLICMHGKSKD